ncbi:MAG: alpha-hydroxy-acid oxidizing protein [Lactobacillus crispatus]|jgi:isopentenyl diphosphate isomerase/L-lactate dehydrogenase-like FMN-dependent dehydrogenase|nr:alpha-hydroxy-acid oxidizing protein [Lactobacillus crispatus]MCI1334965.1 alpha-hydroxy-acid oxidizing protein [Lactobacillus crispatus]MCI1365649.1 alpha-hydroxy-acid oxidizing protein [Lactobacillus crispatus]MCI1493339.1 alpha-hydroxy-acid oxidizing protein [Lactobacillus crispatus]MCI1523837.1 alpha-hydroxy-acid oxidizing protein [Lactobacillus crispatus]
MIPVTSGRADDANVHNRAYLDNILVEMRLLDSVEPDLTTEIFGKKYASPLTLAAVSHLNKVLPAIKQALNSSGMTIFVDGSLMTGYDAYKALALGADAVLISRGILSELLKDGQKATEDKIKKMNEQLAQMMLYTGVRDTKSFDPSVLHFD